MNSWISYYLFISFTNIVVNLFTSNLSDVVLRYVVFENNRTINLLYLIFFLMSVQILLTIQYICFDAF